MTKAKFERVVLGLIVSLGVVGGVFFRSLGTEGWRIVYFACIAGITGIFLGINIQFRKDK